MAECESFAGLLGGRSSAELGLSRSGLLNFSMRLPTVLIRSRSQPRGKNGDGVTVYLRPATEQGESP
jgi:hypothetical protein